MMTSGMRYLGVLLGCLCLLGTCAAGPAKVWKMSAEEIQAVSVRDLCDALAVGRKARRETPIVDAEVKRRKISCAEAVEKVVSDCSSLRIQSLRGSPAQGGTIFTISNSSRKAKSFRIYYRHFQSSLFYIQPGATADFGVRVDSRLGAVGSAVAQQQGDTDAMLTDCVSQ
jgi:hypothetical protein